MKVKLDGTYMRCSGDSRMGKYVRCSEDSRDGKYVRQIDGGRVRTKLSFTIFLQTSPVAGVRVSPSHNSGCV